MGLPTTQGWATTRSWPGVPPCATTLQACIDASGNGDRIEIVTDTPIAEDPSFYDVDRTLAAAEGMHPSLAPGHGLSITTSSIWGSQTVGVSGLSFTDGYVFVNYQGTGTGTYDLRDLVLTRGVVDSANYIEVTAHAGTVNATLYNNRLSGVPRSLNDGLVMLKATGGVLNANAYYNHIQSTNTMSLATGGGIFADYAGAGSGGTLKLHANEVRGAFTRAGIFVSEGLFSSTAISMTARAYSNVVIGLDGSNSGLGGNGIEFVVNNGSINAQAINNTVTRCYAGISATQWSGGGASAAISGLVKNNLVVSSRGLSFAAAVTGTLSNDYNLTNADVNFAAVGAHDITSPAQLLLDTRPRLRAGSPAIDAADTATLGLGIVFNTLPVTDADGLRRITGESPAKADIGAYESGSVTLTQTASAGNTVSNRTYIDHAVLNGNASAQLIATPNYNVGLPSSGVEYNHPFGAYYAASQWALFNQEGIATPMPAGAHFDVLAPAAGSGSFVHVSDTASVSGAGTVFSDSSSDNLPDRIVLLTQNWTAGGSSLYNPHPVSPVYGDDAKWHIVNADGAAMQPHLGFNVYVQEPSPNAYRATVTPYNTSAGTLFLNHPLLDGMPCARPHITRLPGAAPTSHNFEVEYDGARWLVNNQSTLALGDQFDILVDPAQVADCLDRIFTDGFG